MIYNHIVTWTVFAILAMSYLQNVATNRIPHHRFLRFGYRNQPGKFAAIMRYYRDPTAILQIQLDQESNMDSASIFANLASQGMIQDFYKLFL